MEFDWISEVFNKPFVPEHKYEDPVTVARRKMLEEKHGNDAEILKEFYSVEQRLVQSTKRKL